MLTCLCTHMLEMSQARSAGHVPQCEHHTLPKTASLQQVSIRKKSWNMQFKDSLTHSLKCLGIAADKMGRKQASDQEMWRGIIDKLLKTTQCFLWFAESSFKWVKQYRFLSFWGSQIKTTRGGHQCLAEFGIDMSCPLPTCHVWPWKRNKYTGDGD